MSSPLGRRAATLHRARCALDLRRTLAVLLLGLAGGNVAALPAQVLDTTRAARVDTVGGDTARQPNPAAPAAIAQAPKQQSPAGPGPRVSPLGAFLRSLILPGWGHAAVGAYARGGFYVLADASTGWGLFKSSTFLKQAHELEARRVEDVRRRLTADGITDPDSVTAAIDGDNGVRDARDLVESRREQREDWLALGIFLLFLGGADAFVSAHLADFPPPVAVTPRPDGALELRLSIPVALPGEAASARAAARRPRE